jgi:hypothetical protein
MHFLSTLTHISVSGLNVLAWILVFLFVYETKKATLEEINSICEPLVLFSYITQHFQLSLAPQGHQVLIYLAQFP